MGASPYEDSLQMAVSFIQREDSIRRSSIPASQRLSAALRFLATGQALEDLKVTTTTAAQTLSETLLPLMCPP
jgi:hypothetical protein